jgi:phage-related protein
VVEADGAVVAGGGGLWEVRSDIRDGIARVVFLAEANLMVVLHGFVKKSQKTPRHELETARKRAAEVLGDKG